VFAIGASLTLSPYAKALPPGKDVIQLSVDERDLNKDYHARLLLLGDAKHTLRALLDELARHGARSRRSRADVDAEVADRWRTGRALFAERFNSDASPISPYRVVTELEKLLDVPSRIVTHDAGRPRDQLAPWWRSQKPRGYLGWGKSTHLGWGLGLAMGARAADPARLCVSWMGDAAIGMVGVEIETAVRERLPVLAIVLNNSGMSFYEERYPTAHVNDGFKRLSGNYADLATALGAAGERVVSVDDLARARDAVASGRAALVEVISAEERQISDASYAV
jgi:acetolactate synthase I/II/III large subunit